MLKKDEAQATVKTDEKGRYYDLSKDSPLLKKKKILTDKEFTEVTNYVRPRFMITPNCNAWCIFCSNEGSSYATKKQRPMNLNLIIKLSEMMIKGLGIKAIDFSGGEPLLHPDFAKRQFRLLEWTKKYPHIRFAIHTNGIALTRDIVDQIKKSNISRIGISVHSLNFDTWNKITNKKKCFNLKTQKIKFNQLLKNLDYLSKQGIGNKIMFKTIVIRNINDSEKEIAKFLKATEDYNFHPRFIQYEPMYKEDRKNIVGRKELFKKLITLGCKFEPGTPMDNSLTEYIPLVNFKYNETANTRMGLHGLIECGTKAACLSCYKYLVAFIKPSETGEGAFFKPCSVLDTRFDLTQIIKDNNIEGLRDIFRLSREYLLLAPGLGTEDWHKERV